MLDFIKEKTNAWEYLKNCGLPIFIYGMGDGALKIIKVFNEYGIAASGFFASDDYYRAHVFEGHYVHTLSQIEEYLDEFVIVLAFAAGYERLYNHINELAKKYVLLAPDVPVAGDGLFTYEYCLKNADKIDKVYNMLEDEKSRSVFADVVNFKISGKIDYLNNCTTPNSEVYDELIKLTDDEVYVDLGAYNGDTVQEFLGVTQNKYKSIHAFEPNEKNFKRMLKRVGDDYKNIYYYNGAAWSKSGEISFTDGVGRMTMVKEDGEKTVPCYAVDESVKEQATLIKLDVEGAEHEAIIGAKRHIAGGAKIICALYHRNEDMFDIPLQLIEINPKLKFKVRHQLYIPAWETNLYAHE